MQLKTFKNINNITSLTSESLFATLLPDLLLEICQSVLEFWFSTLAYSLQYQIQMGVVQN